MSWPRALLNFGDEPGVPRLRADAVRDYLRSVSGGQSVQVDPEYLRYLEFAHGRHLANCWFLGPDEIPRQVDRVFSFVDKGDLTPPFQPSWRPPGDQDSRLDVSVPYFESMMPNWEERDLLMPFAGVGTEGAVEYDMLCFHYDIDPGPRVVFWIHGENGGLEAWKLHPIANDFSEFQVKVFER